MLCQYNSTPGTLLLLHLPKASAGFSFQLSETPNTISSFNNNGQEGTGNFLSGYVAVLVWIFLYLSTYLHVCPFI